MKNFLRNVTALVIALGIAATAHAQTLNFSLATSSSDGKTVVPTLTWSTSPAASSCTASGTSGSGWTGPKANAGTEALAPTSTSAAYSLQCTWPGATIATVNWIAPTTNTDGSNYTNPGGFKVYYGTSATNRNTVATITDPTARSWTSPALAPGQWFFGVRAVNALGLESDDSNVASKTMTANASQNRQLNLSVTVPAAPVMTLQ